MNRYLLRTVVLAFSFLLLLPAIAQERKKVGVVLSGGGAKGVAHIGALRVIEEAGIPIDYIVGTSMGSIIGGLYAIGYTPNQLDSMVRSQNWTFLLSDRIKRSQQTIIEREKSEKYIISIPFTANLKKQGVGGMIKGQNLANLFSDLTVGYHDSIDFNKLPIPFACVSQNLVNGNEVVFHSGILSTSMRASMAIPGVFTPVRQDGMVLIDGGMKNNFPTDVAKAMGAEIIIGVTVQEDLKGANELNGLPEIVGQVVDLICQQNYEQNLALTNTHIKVDVKGYSSASFNASALDTLIVRGEQAGREQWESLLALKEEIGISDSYTPQKHGPYKSLSSTRSFFVHDITFTGIEESDEKWMMSKCNIQENTEINVSQLEKAIAILSGSQAYSSVSYKLTQSPEGYQLNFLLEKKYEKNINLGIRFDSEEIASVLLNATTSLKTLIPSKISITGRLSKRYMARVDYTLEPLQMRYLNFSYMYQYNDINIYNQGDRVYNATYNYHLGEFSLSDVWFKNLRFAIGARVEYFNYKDFLYNQSKFIPEIKREHFFSYFGQLHYNTFDKGYFPTKGSEVKLSYSVYTDNFAKYNGHAPFSALTGLWSSVVSVTNRFAVIPTVYGRVLAGQEIAYPYFNALGGDTFGRYVPQQLPFAGINNVEIMNNSVVIAGLKARQRMGGNHYLTLSSNLGVTDDNFFDLLSKKCIYGLGLGYGFDSRFGPLEASFNYSNQTEKVGFYVNLGFTF